MGLSIAIQMDPVGGLDIRGDSTFALGLEAQARGHGLFVYAPDDLALKVESGASTRDSLTAHGQAATFRDREGDHAELGELEERKLAGFDVVLMRQDPPFDMQYISATHLLEHIHPETLVVNDPAEVRNAPEKLLVTRFPSLMPPTLITRNESDIRDFRAGHGDIVVKPLYGNGGAGVFHLKKDDGNLSSLLETMLGIDRAPLMVQQYLPAVRKGDKRVILVDGKAVAALNRVPPKGESRSNLHVGGRPEASSLDKDDMRICEEIGPVLREKGLLFAGIDVIGGRLTEINVTSPTGIREIQRLSGIDVAALVWDAIEAKL